MDLVKVRQLQTEKIFDFGKRVSFLLSKCKLAINNKYASNSTVIESLIKEEEESAAKYFRNGLSNDRIKVRLSCLELSKLSVAIDKAIVSENEEKEFDSYSGKNHNNLPIKKCTHCKKVGHLVESCWYVAASSNSPTSTNINNRNKYSNASTGNNLQNLNVSSTFKNNPFSRARTDSNQFQNTISCYTCGKKGHTSRECSKNVPNANVNTILTDSFSFCQFCNVSNHATRNCRLFTNCLKGLLAQQSQGNEEGQGASTFASVHKNQ